MVASRERKVEKKEAEETMFEVESPDDLCQYHDHISGPENHLHRSHLTLAQ